MKHYKLHELAKFAAGLIAADFISLLWLSSNNLLPVMFLGMRFTQGMVGPGLVFDAALFIILIHYGWHVGKTPLMRERSYLMAAGTLFGFVAAVHLIRIFLGANVIIMGWYAPLWLSWIGTAVTGYLSYMSFHLAMRMKR